MPRLTVLDLRGDRSDPRERLPRPRVDLAAARAGVDASLAAVRERGDDALRELTARFDGVELDDLVVPDEVLDESLERLDPQLRAALERAADQVRWFHERARPPDWEDVRDGARMGVWHRPVERAGVYVPGGKAVYPSTVVMTVVPAQVAGVDEIVLCTPPTGTGFAADGDALGGTPDGWPNRTILAAARLLGVDRVVRVGGAQAIAAMAYGTASVPVCDLVVGPGNLYVSLAKQQLAAEGRIGTDGYAGPTEVAIVADATADPQVVAADLVAQAEHDELATALLITDDLALVDAVEAALDTEVARPVTGSGSRPRSPARARSRWSTTSTTRSPSPRRSRPSTSRSTRPTPGGSPSGSATPARPSSAARRPSASATTRPARTTRCRPPGPPGSPAG
jgi:histidinol dehydrogenase